MDILSDYRITASIVNERELAQRAERARIALERAQSPRSESPRSESPRRETTATGSLVCVPATSY